MLCFFHFPSLYIARNKAFSCCHIIQFVLAFSTTSWYNKRIPALFMNFRPIRVHSGWSWQYTWRLSICRPIHSRIPRYCREIHERNVLGTSPSAAFAPCALVNLYTVPYKWFKSQLDLRGRWFWFTYIHRLQIQPTTQISSPSPASSLVRAQISYFYRALQLYSSLSACRITWNTVDRRYTRGVLSPGRCFHFWLEGAAARVTYLKWCRPPLFFPSCFPLFSSFIPWAKSSFLLSHAFGQILISPLSCLPPPAYHHQLPTISPHTTLTLMAHASRGPSRNAMKRVLWPSWNITEKSEEYHFGGSTTSVSLSQPSRQTK